MNNQLTRPLVSLLVPLVLDSNTKRCWTYREVLQFGVSFVALMAAEAFCVRALGRSTIQ